MRQSNCDHLCRRCDAIVLFNYLRDNAHHQTIGIGEPFFRYLFNGCHNNDLVLEQPTQTVMKHIRLSFSSVRSKMMEICFQDRNKFEYLALLHLSE